MSEQHECGISKTAGFLHISWLVIFTDEKQLKSFNLRLGTYLTPNLVGRPGQNTLKTKPDSRDNNMDMAGSGVSMVCQHATIGISYQFFPLFAKVIF